MHVLAPLLSVACLVPLGYAAWSDIARRLIPDWAPAWLAALGIAAGVLRGPHALLFSAATAAILFAALAVLHGRGILGGGDVKLAAAVAIGLPASAVGSFLAATALAGGVIALVHLALRPLAPSVQVARRTPPSRWSLPRRVWATECWRIRRRGSLPYGVAIVAGGVITLFGGG